MQDRAVAQDVVVVAAWLAARTSYRQLAEFGIELRCPRPSPYDGSMQHAAGAQRRHLRAVKIDLRVANLGASTVAPRAAP